MIMEFKEKKGARDIIEKGRDKCKIESNNR